jgi:hypothetical protein
VQASDLTLRSCTRPGSPLSVGESSSDSFAINPTTLELGGIREGHQSDSKTSGTKCQINLPIPGRARSTLFQWMCAPLGKLENWLAHGCNQSMSSSNLEKEFYNVTSLVCFVLSLPFSEADIHSFYPLLARRVTHTTIDSCSRVRYSPTVVPVPRHCYIGLKALGQCPPHSLMKLMTIHTTLLNGSQRKT